MIVKKEELQSPDGEAKTAKVIEFYVPDGHKRATRWIPESLRGQVIEFPSPLKKPA